MGRYRARDIVLVPGLLSLSRVPLAAAFPFTVHRPALAFGVLLASGLSDVLDGWYARRFHQATPTGAVIDPITDKIFVTTVAITLVLSGNLSVLAVVLLSTREIGELPLVAWLVMSPKARRASADAASANALGKVATAFQFVAVSAALFHSPHTNLFVYVTALAGIAAAVGYWTRTLRLLRRSPTRAV